jgi:tRNA(fMet)-specific endonuclease VapC
MRYLPDTNIWIALLNGASPKVAAAFKRHQETDIVLCSVVKAELYFGALKSARVEHNLERLKLVTSRFLSLNFDDDAAFMYGVIREELERVGTPVGPNDLMIASIAIANSATVVTHNTREFSRIQGLKVEDWLLVIGLFYLKLEMSFPRRRATAGSILIHPVKQYSRFSFNKLRRSQIVCWMPAFAGMTTHKYVPLLNFPSALPNT